MRSATTHSARYLQHCEDRNVEIGMHSGKHDARFVNETKDKSHFGNHQLSGEGTPQRRDLMEVNLGVEELKRRLENDWQRAVCIPVITC